MEEPKVDAKSKPLASASKPRSALGRQHSTFGEDENEGRDDAVNALVPAPESFTKKPLLPLGLPHVPLTGRPKTNPGATLLGNAFFGKEVEEKGKGSSGFGSKLLGKGPPRPEFSGQEEKGPLAFKAPLKPNPHPSSRTDSDWLGSGPDRGGESPSTSPRKKVTPRGGGGEDPFDFSRGSSRLQDPRGAVQRDQPTGDTSSMANAFQKMKSGKFPETTFDALHKVPGGASAPQRIPPAELNISDSDLPPFLDHLTRNRKPSLPTDPDPDGKQSAEAGGPAGNVPRKKVVVVRKHGAGPEPTLQVPSHVIDQDELKRMFQSQKQLYESQLEMLENGYKEQMDCLVQSYSRKEEMLKEEIKMIQKEHEERMGRLKVSFITTSAIVLSVGGDSTLEAGLRN